MAELPPVDEPTLRYDREIGPGYFVQTPTTFLRNPAYSPMFTRLYQVLLTYCGAGDTAFPGQVRLAHECGISERSVRNVLAELEAAGLVTVTRRGLNLTNIYYVHKLPLISESTPERHHVPVKTGTARRPKTAAVATKKESDQIHTVETDRAALLKSGDDRALLDGLARTEYRRVTPRELERIAAAWHASGLSAAVWWRAQTAARISADHLGAWLAQLEGV